MAIGKDGAVRRQLRTLFNVGTVRDLTDGQLLERFATDGGEAAELAFAVLVERHGPMVHAGLPGRPGRSARRAGRLPGDVPGAGQAGAGSGSGTRSGPGCTRSPTGPRRVPGRPRPATAAWNGTRRSPRRRPGPSGTSSWSGCCTRRSTGSPNAIARPWSSATWKAALTKQAARYLGWPVGTVKSRLSRGRERLRHGLLRRGVATDVGVFIAGMGSRAPVFSIPPVLLDSTAGAALRFAAIGPAVRGSAASLAQGVLRTMSMTQWWKAATVLLVAGATASGVEWLGYGTAPGTQAPALKHDKDVRAGNAPTREVKSGKLELAVSSRGRVQSARSFDVYCQVESGTRIVAMVPEGTRVKKGDIVAQLDSAALEDQLVNQRITTKSAEANYRNAKLMREVAEIAVKEYIEGIYKQDMETVKREVEGCRTTIRKIEERLDRTRKASRQLKDAFAAGAARTAADIVAEVDIQDRVAEGELALDRERRAGAGGGEGGSPREVHPRQDDQAARGRGQEGPR